MNSATKVVAGVIALTAFMVAAICGLGVGNSAEITLIRAIVSMFVCYFAGLPLGMICEHVIEEHMANYVSMRPSPESTSSGGSPRAKTPDSESVVDGGVADV